MCSDWWQNTYCKIEKFNDWIYGLIRKFPSGDSPWQLVRRLNLQRSCQNHYEGYSVKIPPDIIVRWSGDNGAHLHDESPEWLIYSPMGNFQPLIMKYGCIVYMHDKMTWMPLAEPFGSTGYLFNFGLIKLKFYLIFNITCSIGYEIHSNEAIQSV